MAATSCWPQLSGILTTWETEHLLSMCTARQLFMRVKFNIVKGLKNGNPQIMLLKQ